MIWIVAGAFVWSAVALPLGILIGRSMKRADETEAAPQNTERRHLYLVGA